MKTLIIGRWGKTHALAKALAASQNVELYSFMDEFNNGIADVSHHYELGDITSKGQITNIIDRFGIEFVVIVPEMTLKEGVSDMLIEKGLPHIGPTAFCTKLESDKAFLRHLMKEHHIDGSPEYHVFSNAISAVTFLKSCEYPVAVKPAGVTEGDGVKVEGIQLRDRQEAIAYTEEVFRRSIGHLPSVIIEEKIEGEEYTLQVLSDGKTLVPLPAVRDYKLLNEGNTGLNTPGMGSYSAPDHLLPFLSQEVLQESLFMLNSILSALKNKYSEVFKGILSGQFMLTRGGIKLVEINVRPGDSEILNITPILETDLMDICTAIAEERLDEIEVSCSPKATVCKYRVPEGFPTPTETVRISIDQRVMEDPDIHLFQSCFEKSSGVYQPSPRLFAITGVGDTLEEAYLKCEQGLEGIRGEGIFHRKDIGTKELTNKYRGFDFLWEPTVEEEPELP